MEREEFQKFNARFQEWMVRQHKLFGTECYLCHDGTWDVLADCPLPHPSVEVPGSSGIASGQ